MLTLSGVLLRCTVLFFGWIAVTAAEAYAVYNPEASVFKDYTL